MTEATPQTDTLDPTSQERTSSTAGMTGAQKAAAVIIALGADKASQIYKYMDAEDVERLTVEVAQMGFLSMENTEEILSDFFRNCMTSKAVTEGGLEYARMVLEKAYGQQAADELLSKVTRTLKNRRFSFMQKAGVRELYSALQNERSQTIALVLSHLSADKAAGVLAQLDEKRQVEVVEGMADIDSVHPDAIKIVEAEMNRKFSTIVAIDNIKVGGIDYVASVMNNLDRTSEKSIFEGISADNQELADEIRKRMFVFEDIVTMDDRTIQRFIRECDTKDVVLSLKTANKDVANKLFANMSTRTAQNIKEELEITTNVRLKDVEAAQQRIVDIIRKLEEQGEIIIMKGGKDDIIV